MVTKCININKTNINLKKNEYKKNTMIYGISNAGTGLGQAQNCGRVN
jgi:hypothetical protein